MSYSVRHVAAHGETHPSHGEVEDCVGSDEEDMMPEVLCAHFCEGLAQKIKKKKKKTKKYRYILYKSEENKII